MCVCVADVLWIQDAFGDLAGFVNGFNSLFSNVIDLPVYVVRVHSAVGITNTRISRGASVGIAGIDDRLH